MSSSASQRALDYLEQLPGTTFTKLYQQPSTALAIFRRMLPHLAKNIVMAMLYMPSSLLAADLDAWIKPDAESAQARDKSLSILQRLRILEEDGVGLSRSYRLNGPFARSLRMALTGGGEHRSFGVPSGTPDKTPVTVEYLDAFARKQWEGILYYVVGSVATASTVRGEEEVSAGTKQLLQKGEFVTVKGRTAHITEKGFSFLLQEINAQIWTLLIVYLEVSGELHMDPVDVLSFLFTLGSLELGISYSTSNLTPTQQQMLEDLTDFGLVYRRTPESTRYYPTRLATTLTSDAPALPNSSLTSTTTTTTASSASSGQNEKGYIILETNYRLYAYTSSPLLISILSLFTQLGTRYPNLITAKITKTSILRAIASGITSQQIITYLATHAHPILRTQTPILPPTVVDQIRLWQIEGERMTAWKGYLIKDVGSAEDYEKAVKYAEALGVLRKEFKTRGSFFVTRMDQMSVYFKNIAQRRRAEQEARQGGGAATEGGRAGGAG